MPGVRRWKLKGRGVARSGGGGGGDLELRARSGRIELRRKLEKGRVSTLARVLAEGEDSQ